MRMQMKRKALKDVLSWLGWAMALGTVVVSAYVHWRAGFTFPPPWNDEPWFLWTSVNLAENGQWASPSLRPGAALVLSPLYALIHAGLFKVFGVGLRAARWCSWFCMMVAFAGVLRMLRRAPWKLALVGSACVFALGASSVVAGNMARPEAMLWMLGVWGCALAGEGKTGPGLVLAVLGLDLHPVGVVMFAGVVGLSAVQWLWRWTKHEKWTATEKAWLCIAIIVFAGVLVDQFVRYDASIAQSTAAEDNTTLWRRLAISYRWGWIILGSTVCLWRACQGGKEMGLPTLGLLGMAPLVLRSQMWYFVYEQQGYGALTAATVWFLCDLSRVHRKWLLRTVAGMVFAGMALFAYRFGFVTGPRGYPGKLEWGWGLVIEKKPPAYLTEEDVEAVVAELAQRTEGMPRPLRVMFVPEGDGLFFHGHLPDGVIPYMGVRTEVPGDVLVFRQTRHMPAWALEGHGLPICESYVMSEVPFRERDGSERWYYGELRKHDNENVAESTQKDQQ